MLWSKWWYAIQPIHGAVVRLTCYAAVAYCHLTTTLVLLVQQYCCSVYLGATIVYIAGMRASPSVTQSAPVVTCAPGADQDQARALESESHFTRKYFYTLPQN